ncbi:hypothetical protein, partial [Nocardia farcinica]
MPAVRWASVALVRRVVGAPPVVAASPGRLVSAVSSACRVGRGAAPSPDRVVRAAVVAAEGSPGSTAVPSPGRVVGVVAVPSPGRVVGVVAVPSPGRVVGVVAVPSPGRV